MFSISLNFTAEHAENAKASESSAWIETVFLIKNSPANHSIQQRKEKISVNPCLKQQEVTIYITHNEKGHR